MLDELTGLGGSRTTPLFAARCALESSLSSPRLPSSWEQHMHATLRRYEGVDRARSEELTLKASQSLVPRLSELPGFNGYYLIQADDGVLTSVSLFDTSAQTDES